MNRVLIGFLSLFLVLTACEPVESRYNVVLIFADDLGYGDLACYGNPTILTPNLDQLAHDGVKYTQFYVTSPVCSPSRSSLLSGCYPKRIDLHRHVIFPNYTYGINPNETLLPEMFQKAGYATACFGKWHLGHQLPFLPLQNGFDEYTGLPFSNDMSAKYQHARGNERYPYQLPWMVGNDTIVLDPDQHNFTKDLTTACLDFIRNHADEPFMVYFPHPMPHIPIYSSDSFQNISRRGRYGDVISEIDWSTGQVIKLLQDLGIYDQTFVFFSSDNGPWKPFKTEGGSSGPLRGEKGTTWEGGMREPCIIHWPEPIVMKARTDQTLWSTLDLLPTLADLCNLELPELKIDGQSRLKQFQTGQDAANEPFYYYSAQGKIEGVRINQWKYRATADTAFLFNVEEDIGELYNLIQHYPALADSLKQVMLGFDAKLDQEIRQHGKI